MNAIDHRAEAERLIGLVEGRGYNLHGPEGDRLLVDAALAHAILAASTPVADQHASEALVSARQAFDALARKHVALHEAVRTLVQSARPAPVPGYWMAPEDLMKRLADLVGEVSS